MATGRPGRLNPPSFRGARLRANPESDARPVPSRWIPRRAGARPGMRCRSYSAACMAPRGRGAMQKRSGRSNRKVMPVARTAQHIASAPMTPAMVTMSDIVPTSGTIAGLEQHRARRRHGQEEGEIDDDRMLAAIAQRFEHLRLRHQRGERDHRRRADETKRKDDQRRGGDARIDERAVDGGPGGKARRGAAGARLHRCREGEDARREQVAGVEIDEASGEFVDRRPAGVDRGDLQRRPPQTRSAPAARGAWPWSPRRRSATGR